MKTEPHYSLSPVEEDALLMRIYRIAQTCRAVDERMWTLARQGVAGFVLTPRGHEVVQIGVTAMMRLGVDSAWLYYRDMAAALGMGVTPYELFLGCLARADDPHSGGRQLSIHLSSPRLRIGSMSSSVGSHIPHAVGAAYAARVRSEGSVAVCFFGDGATSEGDTHEAMNIAGVHKLPVVFVCENNGYAISVPAAQQMAVASFADRGAAYGMPGVTIDGTDALVVARAAHQAIERARRGDGPSVIDARVPRMTPHSSQDDDAYRSQEERSAAEAADPLVKLGRELLVRGVLEEGSDRTIIEKVRAEVDEAVLRATAQPQPAPERAHQWLYAGDAPHPYLSELEATGIPREEPND